VISCTVSTISLYRLVADCLLFDRSGVSIRNLRKSFPAANEGILTWIADSCCGALRWCLCRPSRTSAGASGDDDGPAAEEEVDPAARETVAVKGLSLDMYDGQIFVLLGEDRSTVITA